MKTKYCRCGYPIVADTRWNGQAHILVFHDGRTNAQISECPGCGDSETNWLIILGGKMCLKANALLDEPPKIWTWQTPGERGVAVYDNSGKAVYSAVIPADVVVCDLCNAGIGTRPVPVLWDGYVVCAKCFASFSGLTLEEAARRDGIRLEAPEQEGICSK